MLASVLGLTALVTSSQFSLPVSLSCQGDDNIQLYNFLSSWTHLIQPVYISYSLSLRVVNVSNSSYAPEKLLYEDVMHESTDETQVTVEFLT